MSQLSTDEQRTLLSLFAVTRSPLMFGGDLLSTDKATLSLLTNREMLCLNQQSTDLSEMSKKPKLFSN